MLNVGGVANVTFIDGERDLVAFDTGPGNALIDDFLRLRTGQMQDDEGRIAAAGKVDEAAVERVLAHPFFARRPPKSLDRNDFRHWVTEEARLADKSTEDGAATITAITVAAVVRATTVLPGKPASWIVAGGGTRNPTLMKMLVERLKPAKVKTALDVGWSADALEAQAFAYLAVRAAQGPAAHLSGDHRRAAPADRRDYRAVTGDAFAGGVTRQRRPLRTITTPRSGADEIPLHRAFDLSRLLFSFSPVRRPRPCRLS